MLDWGFLPKTMCVLGQMNEPFFPIGQKVLALVFALNGKPDKLGFTKAWAI